MDKQTQENRATLVAHLARLCPDIKPYIIIVDVNELARLGARAHRHAERMCSEEAYYNSHISDDGETDRTQDRIEANATKIAGKYDMTVTLAGDPRGFVFYLHRDGLPGNTWGGDEHGYGLN